MRVDSRSLLLVPLLSRYYLSKFIALSGRIFNWIDGNGKDFELLCNACVEPEEYRQRLNTRGVRSVQFWLTHVEGEPMGMAGLFRSNFDPPEICTLIAVGVDPEYRGQGVGTRIVEWMVSRARVEGVKTLKLCVEDRGGPNPALNLYLKAGFEVYRASTKEAGQDIYMARELP